MAIPNVDVNYIAVLISGVISIILGSLWYSPVLFGNAWMKEMGISVKDIEKTKKKGMGKYYFAAFIGALVTAFILGIFIKWIGASSFFDGIQTGFWAWLGFIVPVSLGSVLWENKSIKYYLINVSYHLVNLALMGGILGMWG